MAGARILDTSMNPSRRIAFAMAVSWVSRALSILATLYLIPTLFAYMSKEELGIWYLLGNSQALLGLFGFGVAPVLTRHIAFRVKASHLDHETNLSALQLEDLGPLLITGRTLLRWMAVATFLVAWGSGYLLIRQLSLHEIAWSTVLWSWTLMCAGWALGVWMSYLDCWVAGLGYVGWDTLITMSVASGTVLANIVAVRVGGGLLALAWIALVSVFIQRALLVVFLRRRGAEVLAFKGKWSSHLVSTLMKPSLKLWTTLIGGYLLYKTDQYFIALFRGVSEVALYQSTYATVFMIGTISLAYVLSSTVFVSQFWASGNMDAVHSLLIRGCRISFVIATTGSVFLLTAGREFFQLWLHGAFIGYPVLIVLVATIFLDNQHMLLTSISRATEDEKYAVPAILAGVLNLLFTWYLIKRFGLIGAPLGTLFAQLLTNNWYGVYRPLVRLRFPFSRYVRLVLAPVAALACIAVMFTLGAMKLSSSLFGPNNMALCLSALAACGLSCMAGLLLTFRHSSEPVPVAQAAAITAR